MNTRNPQITQASSADVVQFSRWASSAKEHTVKICTLTFERINRDHELSAHARCVGIEILSHVNWRDGFAEVSMEKTAERLGFKEDTATKARDALVGCGYFRYRPGKPGRGYQGKYWPVLQSQVVQNEQPENPQRVGVLEPEIAAEKTPISRPENPHLTKIKPPRRGVEQLREQSINKKSAPPARRSARVERGDAAKAAPRPPMTDRQKQAMRDRINFENVLERRPLADPAQKTQARQIFQSLATRIGSSNIEHLAAVGDGPDDAIGFLGHLANNAPSIYNGGTTIGSSL